MLPYCPYGCWRPVSEPVPKPLPPPVAEAMRVPAFGTKPVLEPLLPSPVAELLSELPLFGADPPQLPAPPLSAVPDPDPGPVPDAPSGCFPTAPDPALNPA